MTVRALGAAVLILAFAGHCYAKRVIIMIADGQGFNCVKAANMYKGNYTQAKAFDMADVDWDVRLAMRTNSANNVLGYDPQAMWANFEWSRKHATDSSSAASAMFSGQKILNGQLNLSSQGQRLTTLFEQASKAGYATGVVTSVEISHATPAATTAHNKSRDNFSKIANEMIYESGLDVIMGAGHPLYDNDAARTRANYDYVGGAQTWADITDSNGANGFRFIESKADFETLAAGKVLHTKYLGIATVRETLQQKRKGSQLQDVKTATYNAQVPSLAAMSLAALNVLEQDKDGFALMIEGGAVDWANHANQKGRMIEEETAFMEAVASVADWVEKHGGWDQTLLIVSADHETGQLYGPVAGQFNDIISQGTGHVPLMNYNSAGHTNALVPLYAKGAGAKNFEMAAIGIDKIRGKFVDNTSIYQIALKSLVLNEFNVKTRVAVAPK